MTPAAVPRVLSILPLRNGRNVKGHLILLSSAGKLSSALCSKVIHFTDVTFTMTRGQNKKELESLEESGGLKGQDIAEVFKTSEGKTQCSKHLGRFGLLIFILNCFLLYYIMFCLLGISRGGTYGAV